MRCDLVLDEAVAPVHRTILTAVHNVCLIPTVWLRHTMGHTSVATATQSLVALAPAQPLPGTGLDQAKHSQRQA